MSEFMQFLSDNIILVICGAFLLGYFGWQKIKGKKEHKITQHEKSQLKGLDHLEEEMLNDKPVVNNTLIHDVKKEVEPSDELHVDFDGMFSEGDKSKKVDTAQEDVVSKIKSMADIVEKDSMNFDKDVNKKFNELKDELKDVHSRKKEIHGYGKKLSELYSIYVNREKYLTALMMGLENVMKIKTPERLSVRVEEEGSKKKRGRPKKHVAKAPDMEVEKNE